MRPFHYASIKPVTTPAINAAVSTASFWVSRFRAVAPEQGFRRINQQPDSGVETVLGG
jgi:hypothetical protein